MESIRDGQTLFPWREDELQSLEDSSRILDPLLRAMLNNRARNRQELLLKSVTSSSQRLLKVSRAAMALIALPNDHGALEMSQSVVSDEMPDLGINAELFDSVIKKADIEFSNNGLEMLIAELGDKSQTPLSLLLHSETAAGSITLIRGREEPGLNEKTLRRILDNQLSCFGRVLSSAEPRLDAIERSYFLARLARLDFIRITEDYHLDPLLLRSLGAERISTLKIIPLRAEAEGLVVALADPLDTDTLREFELAIGRHVKTKLVVPPSDIERVVIQLKALSYDSVVRDEIIQKYAPSRVQNIKVVTRKLTPISELVNVLVGQAYFSGASDIHFEPQQDHIVVRFRIDGVCRVVDKLPKAAQAELINRLKIMAGLDITVQRVPQDGRLEFRHYCPEIDIDLRLAVAPMRYGESIVMRLIDRTVISLSLEDLGYLKESLATYRTWLAKPHGMIIHAGPTGSGKSISVFAALTALKSPQIKIVTAEDPIEYTLEGINQLEVKAKAGLTFASALRSFVRLDPDIILLGEMRDAETAQVAFMAALAGPRLFTTLHANDSLAAIPRLRQLGVDTYHIAYSMLGICSQRLLRRLCICKRPAQATAEERALLKRCDFDENSPIYRPGACKTCDFTGFKGRIGAYELLTCEGEVQRLISTEAELSQIGAEARLSNSCTLIQAAVSHVVDGVTAFKEVARVIGLA
jgi:type IV pilus assembly protein PilB